METQKLSEWLSGYDSHGIYDESILDGMPASDDVKAVVPVQSHRRVASLIEQRGLGGTLAPDKGTGLVTGYMMAEAIAEKLVPGDGRWNHYNGRGTRFWAAIDALKDAGY